MNDLGNSIQPVSLHYQPNKHRRAQAHQSFTFLGNKMPVSQVLGSPHALTQYMLSHEGNKAALSGFAMNSARAVIMQIAAHPIAHPCLTVRGLSSQWGCTGSNLHSSTWQSTLKPRSLYGVAQVFYTKHTVLYHPFTKQVPCYRLPLIEVSSERKAKQGHTCA